MSINIFHFQSTKIKWVSVSTETKVNDYILLGILPPYHVIAKRQYKA
jgi:hypothetical protein